MITLILDSTLCWEVTLTLLHVSWIGLLVGLIAAVSSRALSHSSASRRYWLHLTSLVVLASSVPLTFATVRDLTLEDSPVTAATLPLISLPDASTTDSPVEAFDDESHGDSSLAKDATHASKERSSADDAVTSDSQPMTDRAVTLALRDLTKRLAPYVTFAYTLGVLLMLIKLAIGVRFTHRLQSAGRPLQDHGLLIRMAEHAQKLSLKVLPVIATCEQVTVPIVVGLVRPMILIPTAMISGLTLEQLDAVLTHELAHLRRRDHIVIVVQRLLEAMLFFHPVTWYLSRQIHHERECSCDDLVVSIGRDRLQYAESLLRVAELQKGISTRRQQMALAADGQSPSKLRLRIARILETPEQNALLISSGWTLAIIMTLILTITLAAHAAPLSVITSRADEATADKKDSPGSALRDADHTDQPDSPRNKMGADLLEDQINRVAEEVVRGLRREKINYLTEAQRQQLTTELKQRLATRVTKPLKATDFEKVLTAIRHFFIDGYGEKFTRFYNSDSFMKTFAILEWRIWVGMDPLELSPAEIVTRDQQRKWFREFIRSQPVVSQKPVIFLARSGERIQMTAHEYDVFQYEQLLSDPTYPFLFFPFSEERFEKVKQSLQSKPSTVGSWTTKRIYDEHENIHYANVKHRWGLPNGEPMGATTNGMGYLEGLSQTSVAERKLVDVGMQKTSVAVPQIDVTSGTVVAELPGGATIELAGFVGASVVGGRPAEPDVWAPDGRRIKRPVGLPDLKPAYSNQYRYLVDRSRVSTYAFLRCNGLREGQQVNRFVFPRAHQAVSAPNFGRAYRWPTIEELDVKPLLLLYGLPDGGDTGSLDMIGVTSDWGPWQRVEVNGTIRDRDKAPEQIAVAYDAAKTFRIQPDEQLPETRTAFGIHGIRPAVYLLHGANPEDRLISDTEFVAIDRSGARHVQNGWSKMEGRTFACIDVAQDQIDHFEFRLRPYICWIKFNNVSLVPGRASQPEVIVESFEDGPKVSPNRDFRR